MSSARKITALVALVAASLVAMALAVSVGPVHAGLAETLRALARGLRAPTDPLAIIVTRMRLPRVLTAYAVGGALGVAGAALQSVFQNPLAEPSLLGVSGAAAFGAVLAIYAGFAARFAMAVPLAAAVFAAGAMFVLVLAAGRAGRSSMGRLLLTGLAVANVTAAATALVVSFALANFDVGRQVMHWLLGGLEGRSFAHASLSFAALAIGALVLLLDARALDALAMGDVAAFSVGVDPRSTRLRAIAAGALLTGVSVAMAGSIGFVGLIVPYVARRLVGGGHRALLVASIGFGGTFLVLADLVARVAIAPEELRLGVVTAALGAPMFLWLLMSTRAETPS
jgi:iron complex transport system permease protein